MNDFIRPILTETLSDKWGLVQRHTFELRRRSGQWQQQIRETYDRGDGAGVLICDLAEKAVVLTRQFRYPAYYRGENPYLIEVCAGKLEGDDAETCARKEAMEEAGYRLTRLDKAFDCIMSPGSVTERLTLFVGIVEAGAQTGDGGGLADEGEDIEVLKLPFMQALEMVATGEIADAKTVMLVQYAALKAIFD
ncbi:MAG: NUDIX domain-containing protein [Devosia sp.]